jgi:hypothetical protein
MLHRHRFRVKATKLSRLQFLHLAAGAAALPAVSRSAWAQAYPTRPVRLVVGFPPGGSTDILARLMEQWLSERLGQPFIIENRVGAGGNIATEAVVRAPPDGYTLLLVGTANAINATLYDKLNFNFIRDITPIAGFIRLPESRQLGAGGTPARSGGMVGCLADLARKGIHVGTEPLGKIHRDGHSANRRSCVRQQNR